MTEPRDEPRARLDWSLDRVRRMAETARTNAELYGPKILKGFGYPDEIMRDAQDALALETLLRELDAVLAAAPPDVEADDEWTPEQLAAIRADYAEWLSKRTERKLEDYRSGYSCGYADAKAGTPMRDEAAGRLFFHLPATAEQLKPCSVCGNEERTAAGYLTCECHAPKVAAAPPEGGEARQSKDVK